VGAGGTRGAQVLYRPSVTQGFGGMISRQYGVICGATAGPPVLGCALITNGHSNLLIWRKLALMAWAVDVH
jgi:hypothetical protein